MYTASQLLSLFQQALSLYKQALQEDYYFLKENNLHCGICLLVVDLSGESTIRKYFGASSPVTFLTEGLYLAPRPKDYYPKDDWKEECIQPRIDFLEEVIPKLQDLGDTIIDPKEPLPCK